MCKLEYIGQTSRHLKQKYQDQHCIHTGKRLTTEQPEEARHESVRIIKTTTRTKNNLTKNERTVLTALKDNTHLTILPADKGNSTVILNTTDYKQKITNSPSI